MINNEMLSFKEACEYVKVKPGTMRHYCMNLTIPFYKPNKGKVYFKVTDLDNWLMEKRISSRRELEQEAIDYVITHRTN